MVTEMQNRFNKIWRKAAVSAAFFIALAVVHTRACGAEDKETWIREKLSSMTLEEKAAQVFVVEPDSFLGLTGVTLAGEQTREALQAVPVGGFIYMEQNLADSQQVQKMLENVQKYSRERIGLPAFTAIDEEGGTVARIGKGNFSVPRVPDMCEIGAEAAGEKGLEKAEALAADAGRTIGGYLTELGFNLDFAPVADVLSNPENEVVKRRSFGSDPWTVAALSLAFLEGLQEQGVYGALKHFPGHGATAGDTHDGYAYTDKTARELEECEWIPFREGIKRGVSFVMAGHISLPEITEEELPASLSHEIITGILREELGYDGIVITDAMNMGAVAQTYKAGEAAVAAFLAGNDILLMPADFEEAYRALLEAVRGGQISEERLDESVERILRVKYELEEKE